MGLSDSRIEAAFRISLGAQTSEADIQTFKDILKWEGRKELLSNALRSFARKIW